jgi:hypothetical protein
VLESYAAVLNSNGDFLKNQKNAMKIFPNIAFEKAAKLLLFLLCAAPPTLRVQCFSFVRPLLAAHLFCSFTLFTARAG